MTLSLIEGHFVVMVYNLCILMIFLWHLYIKEKEKRAVLILRYTAENHTSPWCFATHNGALEHTESCHTLVHDFVRVFLHEITEMLELFFFFFLVAILFLSV